MDEKPTYQELERKIDHLKRKLKSREQKYRMLLDGSSDPIFSFLPDGTYQFVNRAFAEGVGRPENEIVGKSIWDIFPGKEGDKRFSVVKHVFDSGESKSIEVWVPRPDGDQYYLTTAKAVKGLHGSVISVICTSKNITDRKTADEELRLNQAKLSAMMASLTDHVSMIDRDLNILWVNDAGKEIFGEDIIGKKCYQAYHGRTAPCEPFPCFALQTFEDERIHTHETQVINKDGRKLYFHCTANVALRDKDENPTTVIEISRDISAQKKAEQELLEKQNLLEETQALAHVGSWEWNIRTNGNIWSDELFRIFGYEPRKITPGKKVFVQSLHPHDRARILASLKKSIETGTPYAEEYRIIRPDQSERVIYSTGRVHYDEQGKAVRMVGAVLDITERKRAKEALESEKERLSVTLRSIGDAVIATDRSGIVTLMNPIAENLTGWNEKEAVGLPLLEVFKIVDENAESPCPNPVEQVLTSGKIQGLPNHTKLISRDGNECSIADSAAPIRDMEQNIVGVVLVFRDITAAQRTEIELMKMEKLKSLGVLAGGIAHDFNNFLTGIIGNLSLAQWKMDPNHRMHSRLKEMEKAALRAKDLTQQLLTFSKGGKPVKRLARIDVLARESAMFAVRGSNIRCQFNFPEDLWPARVDPGQIAQVVHNLIINAEQVMPEGGGVNISGKNIQIESGNRLKLPAGSYVMITVQDQGAGIKKEHLGRIFDPYFTTKQKGSGLGLTIVYSILEKHGGCATVHSELGKGSVFSIYVPASPGDALNVNLPKEPISPGSGRILVMDDEKFIRTLAAEMLKKLGYEAVLAKDGAEAINAYQSALASDEPFDAVILDLTVPGGMGGQEAMARLIEIDPNVKAIVSSGYSNDPVISNYSEYGFQSVARKPYLINELSSALRKLKLH